MNEKIIWDYLMGKLQNPYGVAALMGNLFAESSLNPVCASNIKKHGLTNETYTEIVDSGINDNFVTDGIAYGLAQWCYHTRKKALLDLARQNKKSIGDIYLQLDYLWMELQKYKSVLSALIDAKNIREASDIVLTKYEKPANKSESAKVKRATYGQKYYDKYSDACQITISINKKLAEKLHKSLKETIK